MITHGFSRLEELRLNVDKTQEQIAHILNCKREVYRRYEKGIYEIPVWAVIKLAKYYATSTDYILGLTDIKTPYYADGTVNTIVFVKTPLSGIFVRLLRIKKEIFFLERKKQRTLKRSPKASFFTSFLGAIPLLTALKPLHQLLFGDIPRTFHKH